MNKVESLRSHLGYSGCFNVDSIGRSSVIVVLWNDDKLVSLHTFLRTMFI